MLRLGKIAGEVEDQALLDAIVAFYYKEEGR